VQGKFGSISHHGELFPQVGLLILARVTQTCTA